MRFTPVAVALGFLTLAAVSPLSAQGGGKKHHKNDSTAAPAAAQRIDLAVLNNPGLSVTSDASYTGPVEIQTNRTLANSQTAAKEVFGPSKYPAFTAASEAFVWKLNDNQGWAAVIVASDGTVGLSGQYNDKSGKTRPFEVVFALKDAEGHVSMVHGIITENAQHAKWWMSVKTYDLPYGNLKKGGEIRGAYRLPTDAEAKATASQYFYLHPCKTPATLAAGWAPIWSWAAKPKQCIEYTPNYYEFEAY